MLSAFLLFDSVYYCRMIHSFLEREAKQIIRAIQLNVFDHRLSTSTRSFRVHVLNHSVDIYLSIVFQ
jgi:hypothetical protein